MWETWVQSLGWEDPLEKEMATHSSIVAWRMGSGLPWMGCLENPMDGGAWWVIVHGVAKSWTGLSDFTFFLSLYQACVLGTRGGPCMPAPPWPQDAMIEKTVVTKNTHAVRNLFSIFLLGLGTVISCASLGITQRREENWVTWLERVNGGNI